MAQLKLYFLITIQKNVEPCKCFKNHFTVILEPSIFFRSKIQMKGDFLITERNVVTIRKVNNSLSKSDVIRFIQRHFGI